MVFVGSLPDRHWQGVQVNACEISKSCAICLQQYFSHEAPGLVCMDCALGYKEKLIPTCGRCGISISGMRAGSKRCSDCRERTAPIYPNVQCANPACAKIFTQRKAGQQSCGNSCAQRIWKSANPQSEEWNDRRRANYQKRRALKRLLPAENVISRVVFERDGWICGICSDPVSEGIAWPDPLSPSLDHVVPLARGGHHTYQNTQLAHLRCNMSKGDRVGAVTN